MTHGTLCIQSWKPENSWILGGTRPIRSQKGVKNDGFSGFLEVFWRFFWGWFWLLSLSGGVKTDDFGEFLADFVALNHYRARDFGKGIRFCPGFFRFLVDFWRIFGHFLVDGRHF